MKVLVTGGTGYIGNSVREHIKNEGHDVRLLVRKGSEGKVGLPGAYEIVRGDIFNTNACLRACDGCDAVVHLVGIIREFPSKGITFDECHRVATSNIVDAARRSGVSRFVHMSALGTREKAASAYHQTKFAAEQLVQESGLRWTIFRPSLVMGSGDEVTRQIVDLIHKPVVPLINGGETLFQPIALDDVCTAMAKALLMPETQQQIYELGGPDRVTFRDLAEEVAGQLGVRIRTASVPAWMIKPVVAILERFPSFPMTLDQLRMLTEDNVCEIDRYVKTFQIEPKSLAQILRTLLGESPAARRTPVLL
jgi:NADH dehydrogenase